MSLWICACLPLLDAFTIPMRGNEMEDGVRKVVNAMFTIPMRGNEIEKGEAFWRDHVEVYDPHEG